VERFADLAVEGVDLRVAEEAELKGAVVADEEAHYDLDSAELG
jgi:hypothetical protein